MIGYLILWPHYLLILYTTVCIRISYNSFLHEHNTLLIIIFFKKLKKHFHNWKTGYTLLVCGYNRYRLVATFPSIQFLIAINIVSSRPEIQLYFCFPLFANYTLKKQTLETLNTCIFILHTLLDERF